LISSVYYDDADTYEFRLKVLSELFDDVYDINDEKKKTPL